MPKLSYKANNGRGLSYSRLSTLHSCNRKYEIENVIGYRPESANMTFAYGHFVGAGIQEFLISKDLNKAVLAGAMEYDLDDMFFEGTTKEQQQKKSFFHAVDIIKEFSIAYKKDIGLRNLLQDLEVAKFNYKGKEIFASELTFEIVIEDEDDEDNPFTYEGHIDLVLYNRSKNEYVILELKTTSFTTIDGSSYGNSAQALGYAIVLDKLVEAKNAKSAFSVIYLVAKSSKKEFEHFNFPKSILQRSGWINNLIIDIQYLKLLEASAESAGIIYPINGASCFDFFRRCPYYGICELSNERFISSVVEDDEDEDTESFASHDEAMFSFTLDEIIARQQFLLSQKSGSKQELIEVELSNDGLSEEL